MRDFGAWVSRKVDDEALKCAVCVGLVCAVWLVYWRVGQYQFVNYDDPLYVTENPKVLSGLTIQNVFWAFSSVKWFYHPITWLSLMFDASLFGANPAGYHLVNAWFHVANVVLLFLLLQKTTGELWKSAAVAALFAVHPINVEAVAWVSERKGVLSTFFFMLALWMYAQYAHKSTRRAFWLTVALFTLGILCKPMLLTFPFVLLLLDFWPLKRLRLGCQGTADQNSADTSRSLTLLSLLWEKVPFILIAIILVPLTFCAERNANAINTSSSLAERGGNALLSYAGYIANLMWPAHLAVFYPYRHHFHVARVLACFTFFVVVSLLAIYQWRHRPYIAMGWFFFAGTLVPVSGLVRVGSHSMADRYAYIPEIGLLITLTWGVSELLSRTHLAKWSIIVLAVSLTATAGACAKGQLQTWQNSITLFQHAIRATQDNYVGHAQLASAFARVGALEEAAFHYRQALAICPGVPVWHQGLAGVLAGQSKFREASFHYRAALESLPGNVQLEEELAVALVRDTEAQSGDVAEALFLAEDAWNRAPDVVPALDALAQVYWEAGKFWDAFWVAEIALNEASKAGRVGWMGLINERLQEYTTGLRLRQATPSLPNTNGD